MLKAIFLGLVCLFGVSAVFALRPNGAKSSVVTAVPRDLILLTPADEPDGPPSVNSSSKADKLGVVFADGETKKLALEIIQVAPIKVESKPEPTESRVTSWHWHAGSKKITRK